MIQVSSAPLTTPQQEIHEDVPSGPRLLTRLRLQAGLSQNQLARIAHIDPAYVNRIERKLGRHSPSRDVVLRLCEALGLDVDDGDRLLYAFGFAGRVDWQMAWTQAVVELPQAVSAATERAIAELLETAAATAGGPPC